MEFNQTTIVSPRSPQRGCSTMLAHMREYVDYRWMKRQLSEEYDDTKSTAVFAHILTTKMVAVQRLERHLHPEVVVNNKAHVDSVFEEDERRRAFGDYSESGIAALTSDKHIRRGYPSRRPVAPSPEVYRFPDEFHGWPVIKWEGREKLYQKSIAAENKLPATDLTTSFSPTPDLS